MKREALEFEESKKNEVAFFASQLKSFEDELSLKLNLKNLSGNSLSHLLDKHQGAGLIPPDEKANILKIIEQVQTLKNKLYTQMDEEGIEILEENELDRTINDLIQELKSINEVERKKDH